VTQPLYGVSEPGPDVKSKIDAINTQQAKATDEGVLDAARDVVSAASEAHKDFVENEAEKIKQVDSVEA